MSERKASGARAAGGGRRPGGGRGPGGGGRRGAGGGGRRRSSGPAGRGPARSTAHIEPLHPSAEPPDIRSFHEWPLAPEVLAVIDAMKITTPTPIQRLAIQPVLDGRDVIAKAETGTGKTLAFGAPMMTRIDPARSTVLGLVLCPTRELAQQVAGVLEKLGAPRSITVALVVGGEPAHPQVEALRGGAQVVVGTPGRVLDLYGQRFLAFPWTEYVVLDEADEMLEIGFIDDVKKILAFTPEERQTLLFSATFPHDLLTLAREATRDPVEIATAAGISTVEAIEQTWMPIARTDRPLALTRLIEQSAPDDVLLVFCDRRTEVDLLMRQMSRLPYEIKALHGGYDQPSRFRVMSAFRTGTVKALVATDVASRGLDVLHVTHVVNYSVPQDLQDYTHRIGRTGRAGRSGRAITLVTPESAGRWRQIERDASWTIREVEPPGPSHGRGRGRPERPAHAERRPRGAPHEREAPRRHPREARPERGEEPARERAGAGSPSPERTRRGQSTRDRLGKPPRSADQASSAEAEHRTSAEATRGRRSPAPGKRSERRPHAEGGQRHAKRGDGGERGPKRGRGESKTPQRPPPRRPEGHGGFGAGV
jgi:ATP-dependent RNA helicase DeaD